MKLRKIKLTCLLSLLVMGMSTAMPAAANYSVATTQKVENEWTLLETKNGVSCYYKIDQMGSGNGVYLRFVNNTGSDATIGWNVSDAGNGVGGNFFLKAGGTVNSFTDPTLAFRITSGEPVITFTVSK